MRAVTGSVASTKPISLSKASAVLQRFTANENGARPDVAAYLRRASDAFEELVFFHREIRAARKFSELEKPLPEKSGEDRWRKKSTKKGRDEAEVGDHRPQRASMDEVANLVERYGTYNGGGTEIASEWQRKNKKMKGEERSDLAFKGEKILVSDGNLVRQEGDGVAERKDGERRRKKMEVGEEKKSNLGRKVDQNQVVEKGKNQYMKQKMEKGTSKSNRREDILKELARNRMEFSGLGEEAMTLEDKKKQPRHKKKKNRTEH